MKKHKKIAVVLVVFLLLIMTGCGKKNPKEMVIEALVEKEGVVNFEEIFREPTRELEPEIELQYQSNS